MNYNGNADCRQGIQKRWKQEIHQSPKILNKCCVAECELLTKQTGTISMGVRQL